MEEDITQLVSIQQTNDSNDNSEEEEDICPINIISHADGLEAIQKALDYIDSSYTQILYLRLA